MNFGVGQYWLDEVLPLGSRGMIRGQSSHYRVLLKLPQLNKHTG